MTDKKENIKQIPVNELQPNPLQPRGVITSESIKDLVGSIETHGVLEPLVVAHTPAGYQIIVGERRWRASKKAGLEKVPCLVKETSPKGMLELALVENVQREDLNPIERAKAFERLQEEFNLAGVEIAERIGKSAPYISNTLKLLELPAALKDGLLSGLITEGHARALLGVKEPKLMIEAYKMALKESASVRRTEEIVRRIRAATGKDKPEEIAESKNKFKKQKYVVTEQIDEMEDQLRKILDKKDDVKLRRSRVQTKLQIVLKGSIEETEEKLQRIHQAIVGINPNSEGGQ